MRLRAQHVRVLRIQLLDTRRDILPERRPEKDVVVLAGNRRLTSNGNETGLRRSAHRRRPTNFEEIFHVHGRFPRISRVRFILVQPLQTIEILPAQQSVQVRCLLHLQPRVVDVRGGGGGDGSGDPGGCRRRDLLPAVLRVASEHGREGSVGLGPIGHYLIGGVLAVGRLDRRRLDADGGR